MNEKDIKAGDFKGNPGQVFYNRERLHSANGYLSPLDYELQHKAA